MRTGTEKRGTATAIRRRDDGSIDIRHYVERGLDARAATMRRAIDSALPTLRRILAQGPRKVNTTRPTRAGSSRSDPLS